MNYPDTTIPSLGGRPQRLSLLLPILVLSLSSCLSSPSTGGGGGNGLSTGSDTISPPRRETFIPGGNTPSGQPSTAVKDKETGSVSTSVPAVRLEEAYCFEEGERNIPIEKMGYTLSYNSVYRIPNWVAYELLDSELYGDFERRSEFGPDPEFKGRQAYDRDYRGSGWDRGHMAPSGDMKWSSQTQRECFYLINICPQNHNLNSGVWNDLEKQVRKECRYYKRIWVVAGPVVGTGRYGTIGEGKVQVPDAFFKALLARRKNGQYVSIGFYFPNESGSRPLSFYACSVDELEEITGLDLFYQLDSALQDKVESTFDPYDWRID